MNKNVIIIIFEDNPEYTERCLASIDHQTCAPNEICVLRSDIYDNPLLETDVKYVSVNYSNQLSKINEILERSESEYVFFVKSSYVLSRTCLEKMIENSCLQCADIVYMNKGILKGNEQDRLFLYGKWIPKEKLCIITSNGIFEEDQFETILSTTTNGSNLIVNENAIIYSTIEPEQYDFNREFLVSMYNKYPNGMDGYMGEGLLECCALEQTNDLEKVKFIVEMYGCICGNFKNNLLVADQYIKPLLKKIQTHPDTESEYQALKDYFAYINKLQYASIIYEILNCSSSLAFVVETQNFDAYQYYISLKDESLKTSKEITQEWTKTNKELKNLDAKLSKQISSSSKKILTSLNQSEAKTNIEDVQGQELIDFTVNCYKSGKLGFRTITKSLRSWMRCKVRKGEQG